MVVTWWGIALGGLAFVASWVFAARYYGRHPEEPNAELKQIYFWLVAIVTAIFATIFTIFISRAEH